MLQRLVDDFRARAGSAVRLTTLMSAIAMLVLVATGFLVAAAFIFVLQREGAIIACLVLGVAFLVIAMLTATAYLVQKNQEKRRLEQAAKEAAQSAKSAASTIFSDPATLAIGLQLVRIIGVKRLVPLLAIGGIALGLFASQRHRTDPPDTSPAV